MQEHLLCDCTRCHIRHASGNENIGDPFVMPFAVAASLVQSNP